MIFNLIAGTRICWLLFVTFGFFGCANKALKSEVDRDYATVKTKYIEQLNPNFDFHKFLRNKNLSKEQQEQIIAVFSQVKEKSQKIRYDIAIYKVLLFQRLGDTNKNQEKIDEIEKRIRALYLRRLYLMIEALHQTQEIMGHRTANPNLLLDPIVK